MTLQKDGIRAVMSESVERRTLERGRIDYSPDYKSEKRPRRYPLGPTASTDDMQMSLERARLRDAVVEAAKTLVREDVEKWDRLVAYRELHAAVTALNTFEAKQDQKD